METEKNESEGGIEQKGASAAQWEAAGQKAATLLEKAQEDLAKANEEWRTIADKYGDNPEGEELQKMLAERQASGVSERVSAANDQIGLMQFYVNKAPTEIRAANEGQGTMEIPKDLQ